LVRRQRGGQGHIDPHLWQKYREYCGVRRFWNGAEEEMGRLTHKPGGAEHMVDVIIHRGVVKLSPMANDLRR
jgi:hypothetical protein